jgi:hypothetical protein
MRPFLFVALLSCSSIAYSSVMTFHDAGSWMIAAEHSPNVAITEESFADNSINVPELSVTTRSGMGPVSFPGNGSIQNQQWVDCVGKNACNGNLYDTTTFSSTKPLYAFGGTWSLDVASPGGLEIYIEGNPQAISPNQYASGRYLDGAAYSGFFGFVSDTPFDSARLASSYGSQSFSLSDLLLAIDPPPVTTPEPSYLVPAGGLALIGWRMRRKGRLPPTL